MLVQTKVLKMDLQKENGVLDFFSKRNGAKDFFPFL
jgi:hypothetical protein